MDSTLATFQVYQDKQSEYRWRLRSSGNNKVIADCGEGYSSLSACEDGIRRVKQQAAGADIDYEKTVGAVKLMPSR